MSQNKLYVGNLPYSADENDIRDAFEQFGEITEVKLITDRETGRSKGFSFITMESQQAAENALTMNGKEINGRSVKVSIARENNSRGSDRGGRSERW